MVEASELIIPAAAGTAMWIFILSFFVRAILQSVLDRLWMLQNAIYALVGLGDQTPASVSFFLMPFLEVMNLDVWQIQAFSEWFFSFTETEPIS